MELQSNKFFLQTSLFNCGCPPFITLVGVTLKEWQQNKVFENICFRSVNWQNKRDNSRGNLTSRCLPFDTQFSRISKVHRNLCQQRCRSRSPRFEAFTGWRHYLCRHHRFYWRRVSRRLFENVFSRPFCRYNCKVRCHKLFPNCDWKVILRLLLNGQKYSGGSKSKRAWEF